MRPVQTKAYRGIALPGFNTTPPGIIRLGGVGVSAAWLFLLNFCDGQDAVNPGCRELQLVAGVQILGRAAIFYLVLVDKGRCAGCADGSGWRMSKSNRAIDVIELGDLALALTFLSQSPPTDDGDGRRARQTDLRQCHDDLQILVASNT